MKSILGSALLSALLLSACGPGSNTQTQPPTPTPQPAPKTLYQGVWGWAAADQYGTLLDSGAVVLSENLVAQGRTVAAGAYANVAQSRKGLTLLGPISASGQLEVFFSLNLSNEVDAYLAAQDADNRLETVEGSPLFLGTGVLLPAGTAGAATPVRVVLVQVSTDVPSGMNAQVLAEHKAIRAVQTWRSSTMQQQTVKPWSYTQTDSVLNSARLFLPAP